eukprot:364930-Chlamydomonas_euryale.AAC.11
MFACKAAAVHKMRQLQKAEGHCRSAQHASSATHHACAAASCPVLTVVRELITMQHNEQVHQIKAALNFSSGVQQ